MTEVHSDSSTSTVLEKQKKSVLILQRVPTGTGVVCQSIAPNMPFKVCVSVCRAHIIKITDQFRDMWPAMPLKSHPRICWQWHAGIDCVKYVFGLKGNSKPGRHNQAHYFLTVQFTCRLFMRRTSSRKSKLSIPLILVSASSQSWREFSFFVLASKCETDYRAIIHLFLNTVLDSMNSLILLNLPKPILAVMLTAPLINALVFCCRERNHKFDTGSPKCTNKKWIVQISTFVFAGCLPFVKTVPFSAMLSHFKYFRRNLVHR